MWKHQQCAGAARNVNPNCCSAQTRVGQPIPAHIVSQHWLSMAVRIQPLCGLGSKHSNGCVGVNRHNTRPAFRAGILSLQRCNHVAPISLQLLRRQGRPAMTAGPRAATPSGGPAGGIDLIADLFAEAIDVEEAEEYESSDTYQLPLEMAACLNHLITTAGPSSLQARFCTNCGRPLQSHQCSQCGHSIQADGILINESALQQWQQHLQQQIQQRQAQQGTPVAQSTALALVFDERMLQHRASLPPYPERPERLLAIMTRLAGAGLLERCQLLPAREATDAELYEVHAVSLVKAIQEASAAASAPITSLTSPATPQPTTTDPAASDSVQAPASTSQELTADSWTGSQQPPQPPLVNLATDTNSASDQDSFGEEAWPVLAVEDASTVRDRGTPVPVWDDDQGLHSQQPWGGASQSRLTVSSDDYITPDASGNEPYNTITGPSQTVVEAVAQPPELQQGQQVVAEHEEEEEGEEGEDEPFVLSSDTLCSGGTYTAAKLAAGAAAQLVHHVMSGQAGNGLAVIRPLGQQASRDTSQGGCYFNNAAVAAAAAQEAGAERVMVLDWDVHHARGTQSIFEDDPDILVVSLHQIGEDTYPGTGGLNETGYDDGLGFTINIPWQVTPVGDAEYLQALSHVVLPVCHEFQPDVIIVSAGFSAAQGDPLGDCHVTPAGFAHMTHMLKGVAPLVMLLEGGYNLDVTARCVEACTRVLLGERPPPLEGDFKMSKAGTLAIMNAIMVQAQFWKSVYPFSLKGWLAAIRAQQQAAARQQLYEEGEAGEEEEGGVYGEEEEEEEDLGHVDDEELQQLIATYGDGGSGGRKAGSQGVAVERDELQLLQSMLGVSRGPGVVVDEAAALPRKRSPSPGRARSAPFLDDEVIGRLIG